MFFNSNQLSNAQITLANAHDNPISYCWRDPTKYQDFAGNKAPICSSAGSKAIPQMHPIGATRKTGGSNWGYKPPLLTRASRRGFSLCSSLSVIATLAAPKGAYLTNGSSYSFTLSLSTAISCFSWSLIYFLIVSSLRPTVLT